MEIMRTIFSWFDLPWRELTYENMFDKVKQLKTLDKEAIRFSKYIPLGMAGAYDDAQKQTYQSKLAERLARMQDRNELSGTNN